MAQDYDYLLKIVMIGDSGVGKSCLLKRFSTKEFSDNYISTIGVDFEIQTLDINGKIVKLQIWDTAGQERFHNITTSYYRGAHCIMLVYDVTNSDSFRNLNRWMGQIKNFASKDTQFLIVGNKADLTGSPTRVDFDEACDYAKQTSDQVDRDVDVIETSAKSGYQVNQAFRKLASQGLKFKMERDAKNPPTVDLHNHKEDQGPTCQRPLCC